MIVYSTHVQLWSNLTFNQLSLTIFKFIVLPLIFKLLFQLTLIISTVTIPIPLSTIVQSSASHSTPTIPTVLVNHFESPNFDAMQVQSIASQQAFSSTIAVLTLVPTVTATSATPPIYFFKTFLFLILLIHIPFATTFGNSHRSVFSFRYLLFT